jgi:hypothetical protein
MNWGYEMMFLIAQVSRKTVSSIYSTSLNPLFLDFFLMMSIMTV